MKTPKHATPKTPKFNPTQWMKEHVDFVAWWKEHRESGYAENRERQSRWGILPWTAHEIERYRAEFIGRSSDPVIHAQIGKMQEEQRKAEEMTGDFEMRFGPMFWQTMTTPEFIPAVKTVVHEMVKWDPSAKLEAAYAPEPGQSEEETELLRRRRDAIAKGRSIFGG